MRKFLFPIAAALLMAGCATAPGAHLVSPPNRQANVFSTYLSARFAASEHDMDQAARYYSQSLKNDPTSDSLLAMAYFYATTSGDIDGAGKFAAQVAAKSSDDRDARLALALVAFKRKDYAEVRKQLALSAKAPFAVLTVSLFDGWAAAGVGDTTAAMADMKTLSAQSGAEPVGAFHAALISDFLGQKDAAAAFYKKAQSLTPNSPRVIEAYGNFLERTDRGAEAGALYQKGLTNPGLAPVSQAGLVRIAAGKKPDPLIRSAEDGAAEGLFFIATSLNDQSSADISIQYLRRALYLRPDLALAQMLLAARFEALHKYEAAMTVYNQVDKSSPYYRMAAVDAAVSHTRLNEKDAAIRELHALAEAKSDDSDTWLALGDAYRDADKNQDAIDAYSHAEKAIGTPAKRDWPLFYARAMAEDKAHQWDKSEADLTLALKLSPEQPELLNYLGYSWVDQNKRIPEALAMLEKARSLRPYDGYIVDSVGWAYYRLGRYDEAATTLNAAVLLVPGDPTINDHFGDALWKAGKRMEARFQWNHALTFSEDAGEKATIETKLKSGLTG